MGHQMAPSHCIAAPQAFQRCWVLGAIRTRALLSRVPQTGLDGFSMPRTWEAEQVDEASPTYHLRTPNPDRMIYLWKALFGENGFVIMV